MKVEGVWYVCDIKCLTLSSAGSSADVAWIMYATKHSTPPIQRRSANPPNKFRQNFIHSGVVLGGVRAFGPSLAKNSFA